MKKDQTRQTKQIRRPLWKKYLLALLLPALMLVSWYGLSLASYQLQPLINDHYQNQAKIIYIHLSGWLYASLGLIAFLTVWIWCKLIFNRGFRRWNWRICLLALLIIAPIHYYFARDARLEAEATPPLIAHRALDNNNAIENTLPAFQLTSKEKPDYIEIDVYETADLDFVVFHDATLKRMAKMDKAPHDFTLAELVQIPITDPKSQKQGRIPSFEQLLAEAEKLDQRLLIDFKTSRYDSQDMVERFLSRYGQRLAKNHHQLQSADENFMRSVLSHSPRFETFLITDTKLDLDIPGLTGYSVQLLTLTEELYRYILDKDIRVYAWTVNDYEGVLESEFLEVDAIITDYMTKTKNDLEDIKKLRDYSYLYYERLYKLRIFPMI